jgi:hypothetical protein
MTEREMYQLSEQLRHLDARMTQLHESRSEQWRDMAEKLESVHQQLSGSGDTPGLVSRQFLTEQRMQLVYWILGGLGTLALGTLWALITEK